MNASLVERLQRHHSESWGWALACCEWRQSLAEDVLQEAYLRVLDGSARFGGHASEKTWFFAVIKRVTAEARRRQRRSGLLTLRFLRAANEDREEDPAVDVSQAQRGRALREALLQLPTRQREVLHLAFYCGLTLEEAADTLGLGLGSVRTHYHRGKTRLAELMEEDHEYA